MPELSPDEAREALATFYDDSACWECARIDGVFEQMAKEPTA